MGPRKAAERFLGKSSHADHFRITLFGSLAATGKGHLTDLVIQNVFSDRRVEIKWESGIFLPRHPNAMEFAAFDQAGSLTDQWTAYSVGGGAVVDAASGLEIVAIYPHNTMDSILEYCLHNGLKFWEYVESVEGPEIWDFLKHIWDVMQESIHRGLLSDGILPAVLY